jgi:hypothetical protein
MQSDPWEIPAVGSTQSNVAEIRHHLQAFLPDSHSNLVIATLDCDNEE